MLYGYVRVSTPKQKPERQIANIKAIYPQAVIVVESYTGTSMDRPEWGRLERGLKQNDQIVFDEVSRMSRNAEEGFCIYEELFQKDGKSMHMSTRVSGLCMWKGAIWKSDTEKTNIAHKRGVGFEFTF